MLATASDGHSARDPVRNERGTRWLGDLGRDLRHAVRGLRRSPGFAASVVLMFALGLGANTAMFGIVYGVLLRPLPYPDAAAIVRIGESLGSVGGSDLWLSNRSMPLLEESAESFEQLAGYQEISARSASLDGATLSGANVSPSLFPLLGSRPQLGRLFTAEEAREGADGVVLLSHGVWTTRFGSDADVVGTLVDLDGEPHAVVGVLEDGFDFPNPDNDFWTPLVVPPFAPPGADDPAELRMVVRLVFGGLGRLRPGVSAEQAATEARTILQASAAGIMTRAGADPGSGDGPDVKRHSKLTPWRHPKLTPEETAYVAPQRPDSVVDRRLRPGPPGTAALLRRTLESWPFAAAEEFVVDGRDAPSRPGRKAHNCHPSRGAGGVSPDRAVASRRTRAAR